MTEPKRKIRGRAKLTEAQVLEVLKDNRLLKQVAGDYGVSIQAIWLIRQKINWKHLHI